MDVGSLSLRYISHTCGLCAYIMSAAWNHLIWFTVVCGEGGGHYGSFLGSSQIVKLRDA